MPECTFVISRWPGTSAWPGTGGDVSVCPDLEVVDAGEARRLEDGLAAALVARGGCVLLIPHVYYLPSDHPAVGRLRDLKGDLVAATWLSPRATDWVLRAHGVDGDGRSIFCMALNGFDSAEDALRECARLSAGAEGVPERGAGHVEEIADAVSPRWYPVLDYSRCVDCRQCLDFCLFGVFTVEEGRVTATRPDNCKPGCPACARVCPQEAIMFPHYVSDPAIAGAAETRACTCSESVDSENHASDSDNDLDDLINALEQLDD